MMGAIVANTLGESIRGFLGRKKLVSVARVLPLRRIPSLDRRHPSIAWAHDALLRLALDPRDSPS